METPPADDATAPDTIGTATYCPEDNKIRLYVGRVPRELFLRLRAEGWTTLHKQREAGGGDFVAVWTPQRRNTAEELCGPLLDEDMGPEDRAADRAERFGGYREKRLGEACSHADRFDAGPAAHGFQSQARAEKAAARHDRIADRAGDAWSKAEYWQRRTAGVISHRLHLSSPEVRMGRIKELESEIRKAEKSRAEYVERREQWQKVAAMADTEEQNRFAALLAGSSWEYGTEYKHPRHDVRSAWLSDWLKADSKDQITGAEAAALWLSKHRELAPEGDWLTHYRLRLAYENQMIEAQGGRAAFVEMQVGGWLGQSQIRKVVKSSVTGRVTSVEIMATVRRYVFDKASGQSVERVTKGPKLINIERLSSEVYRAPTAEDIAAMEATKKAEKAARPKVETIPLINPTDADAERLQAIWNERAKTKREGNKRECYGAFQPSTLLRLTQAQYSANSGGSYARIETCELAADAQRVEDSRGMYSRSVEDHNAKIGRSLCKLRIAQSDGQQWPYPKRVIILTDKPQKPLPAAVWEAYVPAQTPEAVTA